MTPKPPDILRKSHRHTQRKERATAKNALRRVADEAAEDLAAEQRYLGHCACGAIGYLYTTRVPPAEWYVRRCVCKFCKRHEAVYTSDPSGSVEIQINDDADVERYRFALETADFLICRRCGDFVAAVTPNGQDPRAIVNVRLIEDPLDLPSAVRETHESETREQRLRRHADEWTPLLPSLDR